MAPPAVILISASTHFNVTLTNDNFSVWRKHVHATLIGLDLVHFLTGTKPIPAPFLDQEQTKPNPDFHAWYRQDQTILAALIGSCSPTIQSLIASADTSQQAWERLLTSYANTSRSRVISLKSKLASNPKGNRTVTDYLRDMKSIADELALVQNPVKDEDLMVHILCQLGDDFKPVATSLRLLDSKITFPELFEKLVDYERELNVAAVSPQPTITTVNYTTRQNRTSNRSTSDRRNNQGKFTSRNSRHQWSPSSNGGARETRSNVYCQFCHFAGHEAKECRKLARFLRENQVQIGVSLNSNKSSPTANVATSSYMFDSGASNHVDPDRASLHSVSDYGGPEEIVLGNGNTLTITHIGQSVLPLSHGSLSLNDVLCVPRLKNKLISVAKLCKTNHVSVEFFPTHFFVKDLRTGARLMRGENYLDVYYANLPSSPQINAPQINAVSITSLLDWHHKLGHPSIQIFKKIAKCLDLNFNFHNFHCNSCSINKSHKTPFGLNSFTTTKPLQLLYSDVWGPVEKSIDGFT
ncbi:putative RNA-directed DNA polymerase [Helianthus debilis subsp. tardiflorus]